MPSVMDSLDLAAEGGGWDLKMHQVERGGGGAMGGRRAAAAWGGHGGMMDDVRGGRERERGREGREDLVEMMTQGGRSHVGEMGDAKRNLFGRPDAGGVSSREPWGGRPPVHDGGGGKNGGGKNLGVGSGRGGWARSCAVDAGVSESMAVFIEAEVNMLIPCALLFCPFFAPNHLYSVTHTVDYPTLISPHTPPAAQH